MGQTIFPSMATQLSAVRPEPASYKPLGSVWEGEDAELLELMLAFYPRKRPKRILDATVNGGRFWRDSKRQVYGLDLDIAHRPQIVGNNTQMPFKAAAFDVVVYDPPHIPNQGKDNEKDFNVRFGLIVRSAKENQYSFAHTYPPFVAEAYRVLKPEGILFCKITDYVHHHRRRKESWVSRLRLYYQDPQVSDHRSPVENGSSHAETALLLAGIPKI